MFGLRLDGGAGDVASLSLAATTTGLIDAEWWVGAAGEDGARVAFSTAIAPSAVAALGRAGVIVVEGEPGEGARRAAHLLELLPPRRVAGDPVADAACFFIPAASERARWLLERLLLLGRDDVLLSEWLDGDERQLVVQALQPPMYLLMRAREESGEGVRAFARAGDGDLWVEWGFTHPLAEVGGRWLRTTGRAAFVDGAGGWRYAALPFATRSLYDGLVPILEARGRELAPAPGVTRFQVRLRLGVGPENDAELWLLSPPQLEALESLVETAPAEELARFTIARLATREDEPKARYLVREIVRPNVPRVGTRVSHLVGGGGFARAPGTDNLYLPCGRRLVPSMRRDELRDLLDLDAAWAVLLDEDRDGTRVTTVRSVDEAPLSRWVEYVAADHRVELDRLLEEAVFAFPEAEVERAPAPPPPSSLVEPPGASSATARKPRPTEPREARPESPRPARPVGTFVDDPIGPPDEVALRERVRALEKVAGVGGCSDGEVWAELAELKVRLNDLGDACLCLEAALFFAATQHAASLTGALLRQRARLAGLAEITGGAGSDDLIDLAVRERWSPAEAAYFGARVLDLLARGDAVLEALLQQVMKVAVGPLPVSRRLAWLVLLASHRRTGDRLGLTRARERLLGALNDGGLDQTLDLPGFVRFTLALDHGASDGATATASSTLERSRDDQVSALGRLWTLVTPRLEELDVGSAYTRLLFAVGFMRIGAAGRARDLVVPVESELPAHDLPNRVLFQLYMARLAHIATRGAGALAAAAWAREVEARLATIDVARAREAVLWLQRRSEWLRLGPPEEPPVWIRSTLERLLSQAEREPETIGEALRQALETAELFDYEHTAAVERGLRAALRSGNDALAEEALAVAVPRLGRIQIPGHRARAVGFCLAAAAVTGSESLFDPLLEQIVHLASGANVPSVTDLLSALRPALAALRRLGASAAAARLLGSLESLAREGGDGIRLRASVAEGLLQLGDSARATALIDRALDDTFDPTLDYVSRHAACDAVLVALRHWPLGERLPRCARVVDRIAWFKDMYTTSKYFPTHQVLLLERLVDTVTDEVTLRSDRVQGFLDAEEQAVRRRVLADWRDFS